MGYYVSTSWNSFLYEFWIAKISASKAQTVFWIFAGLMGASLSSIFS